MTRVLHTTPGAADAIEQRFREFAIRHILTYPDLHEQARFPESLWEEMRRHRLFGIGLRRAYGGQVEDEKTHRSEPYRLLSIAGTAMAANSGNLGVCLSWMVHELTAFRIIQGSGTEEQKKTYLPGLASGNSSACLAISEPGAGAHPRHLATTAEAVSGGFVLNGEKTYLTNAPLADLFIVVAVSGNVGGKNRFTAFLVPKSTPGLTLSPPMKFPFLRPSPHGGIVLKNCMVRPGQILGTIGRAYDDLVLPFRSVEDALMMGPISGGLAGLLRHLVAQLNHHLAVPDESLMTTTARLHCAAEALTVIAGAAAGLLDADGRDEKLTALGLFFRAQAGECLHRILEIIEKTGITPNPKIEFIINDLSAAIRIAENISKIRLQKLGKSIFSDFLQGRQF